MEPGPLAQGSQSPPVLRSQLQRQASLHQIRASLPVSRQCVGPCFVSRHPSSRASIGGAIGASHLPSQANLPSRGLQFTTSAPSRSLSPLNGVRGGSTSPPCPAPLMALRSHVALSSSASMPHIPTVAPQQSSPSLLTSYANVGMTGELTSPKPARSQSPTFYRVESSPKQARSQSPPVYRIEGGTIPKPQNNWAYLSDTEVIEFAERGLSGVVAPELLKKLNRRDLVALLAAQFGQGGPTHNFEPTKRKNEEGKALDVTLHHAGTSAGRPPPSRLTSEASLMASAVDVTNAGQMFVQERVVPFRQTSAPQSPPQEIASQVRQDDVVTFDVEAARRSYETKLDLQPQPQLKLVAYPSSGKSSPVLATRSVVPTGAVEAYGHDIPSLSVSSARDVSPPVFAKPLGVYSCAPPVVRRQIMPSDCQANAPAPTCALAPATSVATPFGVVSTPVTGDSAGGTISLASRAKMATDSCSLQDTENAFELTRALARSASAEQLAQMQRRFDLQQHGGNEVKLDVEPEVVRRTIRQRSNDGGRMEAALVTKLAAANRELQVAQSAAARLSAANREFIVTQGAAASLGAPLQPTPRMAVVPESSTISSPLSKFPSDPVCDAEVRGATQTLSSSATPRSDTTTTPSGFPTARTISPADWTASLAAARTSEEMPMMLTSRGFSPGRSTTDSTPSARYGKHGSPRRSSASTAHASVDQLSHTQKGDNQVKTKDNGSQWEDPVRKSSRSTSRGKADAKRATRSSRSASRGRLSLQSNSSNYDADDPESVALHLMRLADSHARNGRLTVTEMQTFLRGTPHEEFMLWVTKAKQWVLFDPSRSGTMDMEGLRKALREFNERKMRGDLSPISNSGSPAPSCSPRSDNGRRLSIEDSISRRYSCDNGKDDYSRRKSLSFQHADKLVEPRWSIDEVRAELQELKAKTEDAQRAVTANRNGHDTELPKSNLSFREQDYDELLAAKTKEIEALQRRTEEKMARLGQARRSISSKEPSEPQPQPAIKDQRYRMSNSSRLLPEDTDLPSSSENASKALASEGVSGKTGAARSLDFTSAGSARSSPSDRKVKMGSNSSFEPPRQNAAVDLDHSRTSKARAGRPPAVAEASSNRRDRSSLDLPPWRGGGGSLQRNRRITIA